MADERTPLVPTNVEEERISANNHAVRISTNDEGRIMKLILSVVFSSVCILDGTLYSNGLLKNGLKADQGMNPTSLEYVGAIQVGLCCITSFFAAKVDTWLGPRLAVGGGAALSALGCLSIGLRIWVSCSFSSSVHWCRVRTYIRARNQHCCRCQTFGSWVGE